MHETKPIILYDTDMDTDCDDVGALAMLCEYVLAGRAELLGVVADAAAEDAAPCCEAICRHYGLTPPVGAVYASDYPSARLEKYFAIRKTLPAHRYYNRPLAARVGKCATDYPRAVTLYRELLAGAEDGSVTVVTVGFVTALADLLSSPPDSISPLDGRELAARKLRCVVSMANVAYPTLTAPNFNYDSEPLGTHAFLQSCPVPVFISPEGTKIVTGAHLTDACPADHPLRLAYEVYMEGERRGRSSWDLVALLFALEPNSPVFSVTPHPGEMLSYDADACRLSWQSGTRADAEVHTTVSADGMTALLNDRMLGRF